MNRFLMAGASAALAASVAAVGLLLAGPAGAQATSRRADLTQAVRDRMAFWSVLARSQRRPVDVRAPDRRVEVGLGRDELDAAIDALLSNVFAHTPEGTSFSVQLRPTAPASACWSLIVEDQGSGTGTQPRTADDKHGGTGLGLDIVRRTAALAGGVAEIGRGTSGGYRVEVQLPIRTPEP